MRALVVSAASLLTLVACSSPPPLPASMAQTNQPTTTTQGTGSAGATGGAGISVSPTGAGGAGAAGGVTQTSGASTCDQPAGGPIRFATLAELQQTVRGTWQLCSNVGLFHQPQAGIFIGPDDRYVFLDLVGGQLVRKTGLLNQGHVEYKDLSAQNGPGFFAVSFVSDLDTTIFASPPIFSDSPRQIIINNEGVETYVYATASPGSTTVGVTGAAGTTGAGGVAGTPGADGSSSVPSGCDRPTGDRLLTPSIADMQRTIRGTWALCSPPGLFGQPQSGVLIGDDDSFVLLDVVGGKLVAESGPFDRGHLEYIDTSADNGPGSIQVDFVSDLGILLSHPIFSGDPRQVIIENDLLDTYTYGAVH